MSNARSVADFKKQYKDIDVERKALDQEIFKHFIKLTMQVGTIIKTAKDFGLCFTHPRLPLEVGTKAGPILAYTNGFLYAYVDGFVYLVDQKNDEIDESTKTALERFLNDHDQAFACESFLSMRDFLERCLAARQEAVDAKKALLETLQAGAR